MPRPSPENRGRKVTSDMNGTIPPRADFTFTDLNLIISTHIAKNKNCIAFFVIDTIQNARKYVVIKV
jgi:hypothetical protein